MRWIPTGTYDDASFFEDHISAIIASETVPPPPVEQEFGDVVVRWEDVGNRTAFIQALGGTSDDRAFVQDLVEEQLKPLGYRRASWDIEEPFRKTADWNDLMAKAKRLIQSGQVQILRNGANNIVAQVQGDHGTYQPEIFRQDPNSQSITGSNCDCNWGAYQNTPRTRQFKKYQDRPCAHVLAAYWAAQATPIDEDIHPAGPQGGPQTPPSPFQQAPAGQSFGPEESAGFSATPGGPGSPPAAMGAPGGGIPAGGGGVPPGAAQGSPESVLPQFPMANQPMANPASIPGLKGPTPTAPVSMPAGPGGAFSSVWDLDSMEHMSDELPPQQNGDLVRLLYPDTASLVGRSEDHGAGQPTDIPPGSVGEVLGTHPATGMVNVLWMGKQFNRNKQMQPFGASGWHFPSYLAPSPNRKPGPAIRRTRP